MQSAHARATASTEEAAEKAAEAAEKATAAGVNGVTVSVPRTTVLGRMRLNRVSTENAVASVRTTALDVYSSLR